jgi:ATP synthase protein I
MADREPSTRQSERARHDPSSARAVGRSETCDDAWDAEQQDKQFVPLTRAEAEKLFGPDVSRPSRVTPFKVVAAQLVLSLAVALVWWLFYEPPRAAALSALLSALLGGAVCWVPSALFAARLKAAGGAGSILTWMIGEMLKMGVTVAMFVAIALWYHDVRWLPFLVTFLVTLQTYWLALAWR